MSGPNAVYDKGFLATTEVGLYRPVKLVNDQVQAVEAADTAGEAVIGVAQHWAREEDRDVGNKIINVRVLGVSWCIAADGNINAQSKVAVTSDGRVTTATAGQNVVGVATNGSDDAGDYVEVLLTPGVTLPA